MSDPPDSGSGRHRDWAGKPTRETTRPGPHVSPLDDTAEDFADEPTPIREHHRLAARVDGHEARLAAVEAATTECRIARAAGVDLPTTEAWRRVEERIAVVELEAKAGADLAATVRSIKRRTWAAIGGSLGAVAAALWFALGVARSSGVRAGVDQEREARRVVDAARLDAVEAGAAKLREEFARILGLLEGSRPYRAAPYLGPASPSQQEP